MVTKADLKDSTHDGLLRRVKQLLKKSDRFASVMAEKEVDPQNFAWGVPAIFGQNVHIIPI